MENSVMKRFISILVTISMCICLNGCQKKLKDDIYIFFTSDVHCGLNDNLTYPSLKAVIDDTRAEHKNVLLVDLGDFIQGGYYGALSGGEMVVQIMNEMGYDIVTYGNHEFDYGIDRLHELMGMMEFETLASNVIYTGNKENIFDGIAEYTIREFDGVKVGFIGVLTPDSLTSSTPKFFMEGDKYVYDFYTGENGKLLQDKVQSVVDEVRKQGAKYVVAMTHLGSTGTEPYDAISLIHNTNGIDVVLDGHSHSIIVEDKYPNKDGEDVIISSVGTKLEAAGELIISKEGEIKTMHINKYDRKDEAIAATIADFDKQLEHILNEVVGSSEFDMRIDDDEGIRMSRDRETTVGDFVADAYRYVMETQIGMANGGGVRSNIEGGEITYGKLMNVSPFRNTIGSCKATGQMILDALEFGARNTEAIYKFDGNAVGESGGFLSVSGLKYTIDTSIETPVIVDENDMLTGFSSDKRRVKDVYVLEDGEYVEIDPQKEYTVAATDYVLYNSGDGNTAFKDATMIEINKYVDTDAMKEYLLHLETMPDEYRKLQGRITVK